MDVDKWAYMFTAASAHAETFTKSNLILHSFVILRVSFVPLRVHAVLYRAVDLFSDRVIG